MAVAAIIINAKIDDVAIWNTSLDADEVRAIYNRQFPRYSGEFLSRVMNGYNSNNSWDAISFSSPLPFLKEVTGDIDGDTFADSETTTVYSELIGGLSNGLIGQWNFDESSWSGAAGEVIDSSGKGNHGTIETGTTQSPNGLFGKAASLNKNFIDVNSLNGNINGANGTISLWFKRRFSYSVSDPEVLFTVRVDSANNISIFYDSSNNIFRLKYKAGNTKKDILIPQSLIEFDKWYQFVLTWDVGSDEVKGFINGKQYSSTKTSLGTWSGIPTFARIGANHSTSNDFTGLLDNISVWNRTLTSAEVLQLYRRGSNTVKFQIRTCNDPNCIGESWQGPNGTVNSYFSEILNRKTAGSFDESGAVQTSAAHFLFSDFSSPSANKYFQYRLVMESDDQNDSCAGSPCMPSIQQVEVTP
jgi:hypothetical protein